ncbi:MAG: hypothetical protein JKY95_00095 [Planctomycetaceae bacterium]|nr:hypothetical protein [Planctomycetaceae bacterium]
MAQQRDFKNMKSVMIGTAAGIIMLVLFSLISPSGKDVQGADPQPKSEKVKQEEREQDARAMCFFFGWTLCHTKGLPGWLNVEFMTTKSISILLPFRATSNVCTCNMIKPNVLKTVRESVTYVSERLLPMYPV